MTTTAPRIRQYEQVQRRIDLKPSLSVTSKRTAPQWHWPARTFVSRTMCLCLRFRSVFTPKGVSRQFAPGDRLRLRLTTIRAGVFEPNTLYDHLHGQERD